MFSSEDAEDAEALTIQFIDLSFMANVTNKVEGIALFILARFLARFLTRGHPGHPHRHQEDSSGSPKDHGVQTRNN